MECKGEFKEVFREMSFKEISNIDLPLKDRSKILSEWLDEQVRNGLSTLREIRGPMDRTVSVKDRDTGKFQERLMFGSNNYLGLANDPRVKRRALELIDENGIGLGGPPLLNGHTSFHIELEERMSDFKGTEDTMLFSSGFLANLGWITALVSHNDVLILDELVHASMIDAARIMKGECVKFPHNDVDALRSILSSSRKEGKKNIFVAVEGIYSMDGDIPPLPEIVEVVKENDCFLMVDDAHGTGVIGENGKGILEHYGLEGEPDLVMGTFSKALASTGGFLSGSAELIKTLRYLARPYVFSASISPIHLAGITAALDIMTEDPGLRTSLHNNRRYMQERLAEIGMRIETPSAIIPLYLGEKGDIRAMSRQFERSGLFMNAIEYPAVPSNRQRFRISLMSTHTKNDLDILAEAIHTIGGQKGVFKEGGRPFEGGR